MSFQATAWAIKQDLPSASQKLTLIMLASHADADGSCFPGHDRLAEDTSLSRRTIVRAIEALEVAGFLTRQRRFRTDGTRTSDKYLLNIQGDTAAPSQGDNLSPGEADQVTLCPSPSDTMSQQEPIREPISIFPPCSSPQAAKKGTRLPEDFTLPSEWALWAERERPDIDVPLEGEKFRDYWIAKTGAGAVKRDWAATWRNWIRNGYAPKARGSPRGGHVTMMEGFADALRDELE